MRVYNSGSRLFTYHELKIHPKGNGHSGFNEVPTNHEEGVKKLIAAYPGELSDGGTIAEPGAAESELAQLKAENRALKAQNANLQQLLAAQGVTTDNAPEKTDPAPGTEKFESVEDLKASQPVEVTAKVATPAPKKK